jgi:hypothetical protein
MGLGSEIRDPENNLFRLWRRCVQLGGYGYRSTGHNINSPNINELQINCSIDQQKPVDV